MLKKVSHDPNHFTTIWHYHMISWVISCHIYLQMIWPYIDSTAAKFFGLINGSYHLPHLKLHRKKTANKPVHLRHLSPFFFHQVWHQSFWEKSTLRFKAAESTNYHQIPTNNMKQLMIMLFWCQCAIFEKDHAQQEHQTTELGFGSRGFRHASGTSYNFPKIRRRQEPPQHYYYSYCPFFYFGSHAPHFHE